MLCNYFLLRDSICSRCILVGPITPMRLVGGTNYSGRVEIEYEGIWGTICDRGFDINDAKVICRMKGFNTE